MARTRALHALGKKDLAGQVLLLPCGCYARLITVRVALRNLTIIDSGECSRDPRHHTCELYTLMKSIQVEVVPWGEFIRRTFTPGSQAARRRGCTCPRDPLGGGCFGIYAVRTTCLMHGSRFGLDEESDELEHNTVERILCDEAPLPNSSSSTES